MKRVLKLPTLLGLVLLIIGVVAGIFLINSSQVFKLGATVEAAPKNVRITNITDKSVTVTWTTEIESKGFVKWGESKGSLSKVALEDYGEKNLVHSATLSPITPGVEVYFKINSESKDWDNEGLAWQTKTLNQTTSASQTFNATGSIINQVGEPPKAAIIYVTTSGVSLSATTSVNGTWILPISNYLEVDMQNTPLEISVNAGSEGSASAVIYPASAKNTPVIVLGKTYDFRTLSGENTGQIPESELSLPEAISASSRFEVGDTAPIEATEVTLESVDDGEIVNTTDPEFFGSAPRGTQVEILVESDPQSGTAVASNSGSWKWNPPNTLEPGEHTVTVKWRDAAGILRTITRTFVVSAAEGPAFVSTPSATPLTTLSPTSTPTTRPTASSTPAITPSGTISPTATSSPIALPDSGTLTPTVLLFIMGIGVLSTSIFVWKKADA